MNEPERNRLKTEKDALGPPIKEPCGNCARLQERVDFWMDRALAAEEDLTALQAAAEPLRQIWLATLAMNAAGDDAVIWQGETIAGTPARLWVDDIRRIVQAAAGEDLRLDSSNERLAGLLADALRYVKRREEAS